MSIDLEQQQYQCPACEHAEILVVVATHQEQDGTTRHLLRCLLCETEVVRTPKDLHVMYAYEQRKGIR